MKMSDLFIARCYWVASELRSILLLLGSILLLSFSKQIKANTDLLGTKTSENPVYSSDGEENPELTLRDAVSLALRHNPELTAFAKEVRALEGVTLQVGLLNNPELSLNVENAGNIQKRSGDVKSTHA